MMHMSFFYGVYRSGIQEWYTESLADSVTVLEGNLNSTQVAVVEASLEGTSTMTMPMKIVYFDTR